MSPLPSRVAAAQDPLHARGAGAIPHPRGNLLDHLARVRAQLAEWGASPQMQLGGCATLPTALTASRLRC